MTGTIRRKTPKPVPPDSPPPIKPPKRPKPPKVDPTPPVVTPGLPTGTIPTDLKIAYGRGADWGMVTRHFPHHQKYGATYGVPWQFLMSMEVVESGGQSIPNGNGFPNFGVMQLTYAKPGQPETTWERVVRELGFGFRDPEGQIAATAYVLGGHNGDAGTHEEIFLRRFYPVYDAQGKLCLDCKGQDGHTPRQYLADIHRLMAIIDAAAGGTTPAPKPEPHGDVIDLLYGGQPYTISADYGQPITWQCPIGVNPGQPGNCYEFQKAYGLDDRHHYAYDVSAQAGDGAPLYAPFDGTVVCAGTNIGNGAWGTGCGFNNRLNNYGGLPSGKGAGRLELLHEDGDRSLIIGHVLASLVPAGARVKRGDLIGRQGGMNASHVHLESRYDNGRKIGDPRKLFGGGPLPTVYAERLPIAQPDDDPPYWVVRVTADEVPVLQTGYAQSPLAAPPLTKGETFFATYRLPGTDGKGYWVSTKLGRVPISGTEEVEVVLP